MTCPFKKTLRVLAIRPYTKGFGFALLEGPEQIIDFGLKIVRRKQDKNAENLRKIVVILDWYKPDILVVEDYKAKDCRRWLRVSALLHDIVMLASERKVKARKVTRRLVRRAFAPYGAVTKHQIAVEIAKLFHELESYVPRFRKPWMTEDERMSIFDAVALALTFFHFKHKQKSPCESMSDPSFKQIS
jgi:Holliday junction resolvasome RuvABC endonuclease subunit